MDDFLQLLANGVVIGAIYALIAAGLSLVFGVMKVINLAHGTLVMLGAYAAYFAYSLLGLNPLISIVPVMILVFLFGAGLQKLIIERVVGGPMLSSLMLTFGLSLIIWNSAQAAFTSKLRGISFMVQPVSFLGVSLSQAYLVGFVLAVIFTGALFMFLRFTLRGKAIRATSQNQDVALACGINVSQARVTAFGLGATLAAAAGTIISMTTLIFPYMGFDYLAKAFTIVVLGGLGSVIGAVIAAFGYGILESFGTSVLSARIAPAIPFVLLVVIMIFRPSGLFGKKVD